MNSQMANEQKNTTHDSLLKLFLKLLDDEKEKEIITLVFEGVDKEKILEILINYNSTENLYD